MYGLESACADWTLRVSMFDALATAFRFLAPRPDLVPSSALCLKFVICGLPFGTHYSRVWQRSCTVGGAGSVERHSDAALSALLASSSSPSPRSFVWVSTSVAHRRATSAAAAGRGSARWLACGLCRRRAELWLSPCLRSSNATFWQNYDKIMAAFW